MNEEVSVKIDKKSPSFFLERRAFMKKREKIDVTSLRTERARSRGNGSRRRGSVPLITHVVNTAQQNAGPPVSLPWLPALLPDDFPNGIKFEMTHACFPRGL